jgi:multidrug efflux system membrane fusion protein
VPREAVMTGQAGTYVFIVDGENARMRPAAIARVQDDVAIMSSGVRPGEKVVVEGQSMLTPDARVVVRKPAGAQAPDAAAPKVSPKTSG